jgi:hypothetical protein
MRESIAVCSSLDSCIRRNDGLMTKACRDKPTDNIPWRDVIRPKPEYLLFVWKKTVRIDFIIVINQGYPF